MIKKVGTPPDPAPGTTEEAVVERSETTASGGVKGAGSGAPAAPPIVVVADSEVPEKARRRQFSAEYKLRVLRDADACTEPGEIGALLRREGLYSSHLALWRRQRDEGTLEGLAPRKRGRKAQPKNPLSNRVAELERENARLKLRLKQAETIIDVQKKVSQILGIPLSEEPEGENE
jgi:transposase-like protein